MNLQQDKILSQVEDLELSANLQQPFLRYNHERSNLNSQKKVELIDEEQFINGTIYQAKSQGSIKRLSKITSQSKISGRNSYIGTDEILALNNLYGDIKIRHENKHHNVVLKYIGRKVPIFEPTQNSIIIWNMLISLLLILLFFEIPIYLAWGDQFFMGLMPKYNFSILTIVSYIILMTDMALQFITAYYQHGNLVTKKSKIANNYLHNNFAYDVIAICSFAFRVSLKSDQYRWFALLFYFKLPSLMKLIYQFEEMILLKRVFRTSFAIGKILISMMFAFVLFGCLFFIIGQWSLKHGLNTWLNSDGDFGVIFKTSIYEQFFLSFYFSVGTMTSTMGYGDIIPLNEYECGYCLLGILFSVMILAININYIFKIIEEFNQQSLNIFKARISINGFLETNQVPAHLSERVRQYLNEFWFEEGARDYDLEKKTINLLAPELKEELMYNSYGKFLQEIPMFSKNFSQPFLKALSLQIQESSYSKKETIFRDRQSELIDENCFYFIKNGSVIIHPLLGGGCAKKIHLNKLKAGKYFGEWSFFTGLSRQASVEANSYSLLYYIKRENFIQTLQRFDEDYEQYCYIKDKLIMQNDLSVIGSECWSCGSHFHMSAYCTQTHYRPTINQVINQDKENQVQQVRDDIQRHARIKWPARLNQQKLIKLKKRHRARISGSFLGQLNDQNRNTSLVLNQSNARSEIDINNLLNSSLFDINQIDTDQKNIDPDKDQINMNIVSLDDMKYSIDKDEDNKEGIDKQQQNQVKIENHDDIQRQSSRFKIPEIQTGLMNFDRPYTFKRYKNSENMQNIWTSDGQLQNK